MKNRTYDEDPELEDENDPEFKEEMFQTFKHMGWTPDDLKNPGDKQEYAAWLAKQS